MRIFSIESGQRLLVDFECARMNSCRQRKSSNHVYGGRKERFLGSLTGWLIHLLRMTLRVEYRKTIEISEHPEPIILLFWHGQIIPAIVAWTKLGLRDSPLKALTSASRDGAMIEFALATFGIGVVRGSSSRRGAHAFMELKRAMDSGNDICITPDGPRGPRQSMQLGGIKLAQLTGSGIIAVRVSCQSSWRLKTWDRFEIPKPFSRVVISLSQPRRIPRDLDEAKIAEWREELEKELSHGQSISYTHAHAAD